MKLTNQQILALAEAIRALDGTQQLQVVDGKAVAVFKGYKLSNSVRWHLAQLQGKLNLAVTDFENARSSLIKRHTEGKGEIAPAHPNFNAFAEELRGISLVEIELDLKPLALADLQFEENQAAGNAYPIAVLNALAPLISS